MSFFEFPHTRTYDSDLGWLIETVKKLYDSENTFEEYVRSWITDHESDYNDLLVRITIIENEMETFQNQIDDRFNTLQDQLTALIYQQVHDALDVLIVEIGDVRSEILQLRQDTSREILELNASISAHDTVLRDYIESRLEQFLEDIPDLQNVIVWNPIKGTQTTINQALSDLYSISRTEALTAEEYDALNLEAQQYDSYEIEAFKYDTYAKSILGNWGVYKNPLYYMHSPFTGEYVTIISVINQLASFHMEGAITAADYDAKEITAGDYDALELTAYDYDFHALTLLPV